MNLYKSHKRGIAVTASLCLAAASLPALSGCGAKDGSVDMIEEAVPDTAENTAGASSKKALGRYLEEDVLVPAGCVAIQDMTFLEDGSLALLYLNGDYQLTLSKSPDKGGTWDEGVSVGQLLGLSPEESGGLMVSALNKDGSILAGQYHAEETAEIPMTYYYYTPADGAKELPISGIMGKAFSTSARFGDNGNLFLTPLGNGVLEINPADGSLVHSYEEGNRIEFTGVTGNLLTAITGGTVRYYDIGTGSPAENMDALTDQIASKPENLSNHTSSSVPILFLSGDEENSLFYADHGGLYRYAAGGNVVEQVIDGSLNSLGSPYTGFTGIARDGEGSFYVSAINFSSGSLEGQLYRYTYSEDTPAVPDTELTVYSLKDNSFIRQAAAVFQKKYPNIYLNLESGISEEDAVTTTDALKTLNTEIMAGKGPDILILDGIPADTYIEKGMLADLGEVLKDTELLENIQTAYTSEDGGIYSLPSKFGFSLIAGRKETVDSSSDLTSLADVLETYKEEYRVNEGGPVYTLPLSASLNAKMLLQCLSDSCSPAWLTSEGTLDETLLRDFLTQTNRIYQMAVPVLKDLSQKFGEDMLSADLGDYDRSLGIDSEALQLMYNMYPAAVGGLYTPQDIATLETAEKENPSITHKAWSGQAKNCFIPVDTFALSAKSTQKEAAEAFLQFIFSPDGQTLTKNNGFPVVKSVYEDPEYWNLGEEGTLVSSESQTYASGEELELNSKAPSAEAFEKYRALGKTLTTPIGDNTIIRNAVADAGLRYLREEISLDEAVSAIVQEVNLYLSE